MGKTTGQPHRLLFLVLFRHVSKGLHVCHRVSAAAIFLQFQVQSALSFSSMKWKADLMAIPETNILALKMGYTINMLYYRVITHLLTNLLLSL